MASTKSTELSATEIELKRRGRRRLIGAATIGLLGIVFLPMIFDGEPKRSSSGSTLKKQEISVQVPAKEGLPPLQAPASALAAPVVTAPPIVETPKDAPRDPAKVVAEPGTAKPDVASAPPKPEKSAPVVKTAVAVADAVKKGFAVQLGVFADADNAKQTVAKMKDAKLAVYSDSIPIKSGTATRVRVGPFATREKADSALAEIKLAGGDGKIVLLP